MLDFQADLRDICHTKKQEEGNVKIEILGANTQAKRPRLRVCAYARVSTASDAQEDSLDNQRTT